MLGATGDDTLDLVDAQILLDLKPDLAQVLLTSRSPLGDHMLDLLIHTGVEGLEGAVLQLPFNGVHAQTVCERGVYFKGFLGLPGCVLRGDVLPGARIVEPVAELDDEHADVLGHRDDHLAHGLGLRRLPVLKLVELGDAVDEQGDLTTEVGAQTI